jgi:3-hydroxyisobutyrate dehydrogenase-like beta-hydroxyacid dehydrogenase
MKEIKKIAFIGLGAMGLPMAKRLAQAGFDVRSAVHKNKAAGQELAAAGGKVLPSFAEAVRDADLILSILPNDAAMESVYLDPDFFAAAPQGVRILDMTSCTAAMMKKVAARWEPKKAIVVDAPVSGGVGGAQSGGLTIFAAGDDGAVAALAPVFAVLGKNVFRLDSIGDGKAIKAVNQMLAAVNAVAVAEAFTLARKLGLNPEKTYEIIRVSSGGSYVFDHKFMKIATNDYSSGFKFSLMKKDLGIALNEANGLSVPLAALASTVYDKCTGNDDKDYSVLATVYLDKKI